MFYQKFIKELGVFILGLTVFLFSGCGGATIFGPNPIAVPGPNQTVAVGSEVILDGSSSFNPAGGPLGFHWEQTEGPTVVLDTPFDPLVTFFADIPGQYRFLLTVENDQGLTSSATILITVIP